MPRPPSVLWTAPWRRAPLLLRRSPAVLLAVLAAGLILGAAAAATPLFLSSAANAALTRQIAEGCPPTVGLQVRSNGALGGAITADEPSAHQDAAWVHDVFAALRQVVHDRGAACLVATHDPDAWQFADRNLYLADGELTERSP